MGVIKHHAIIWHVWGNGGMVPFPGVSEIFLFTAVSRPVLGPTQSLFQLVPGGFPPRMKLQGRAVGYTLAFSRIF